MPHEDAALLSRRWSEAAWILSLFIPQGHATICYGDITQAFEAINKYNLRRITYLMVDRIEIMDALPKNVKTTDSEPINFECDEKVCVRKQPEQDREKATLRRRSIEALMMEGKSIDEITEELGISRATLYRDLHEVCAVFKDKEKATSVFIAFAYFRYESKRTWLIDEIRHAKTARTTIKAISVLEMVDKNWTDFLFRVGLIRPMPACGDNEITVRWLMDEDKLQAIATQAKSSAADAEVTPDNRGAPSNVCIAQDTIAPSANSNMPASGAQDITDKENTM